MLKKFLFFSLIFIYFNGFSQIEYTVKMSNPQNHYFEVEMQIEGITSKDFEVKMPVWAPGSYLVRDFSKNINLVKAWNEKGEALEINKTRKNAWKIKRGNAKKIKVNYEVYSFELSVRTSFLDLSHGFISGTGIFMYVEQLKDKSGKLNILPHANFSTITTALKPYGESATGLKSFTYENYDQLVDCPIEIGNQKVFHFDSKGVKHTVAMYGEGNYDIEQLKKDMPQITDAATDVFGENPNKEYVFIIHNVTDAQGGLEHCNSTTLSVNRWGYSPNKYNDFLTLVAHEYFHLWNVKRMRAIELGPFDYDNENYTTLLWVMEGFTSYYEDLIMLRAGFITAEQYLQLLQGTLNYVEGSEGARLQPVAHASFDAWIKAYKPNENSANTTMTYYSRGGLLAAVIDAKIVAKFKGEKCLDHFLQKLYNDYYKKLNRGFSDVEFEKELSKFMGEDMSSFFKDYVYDTKIPDYETIYAAVGINVKNTSYKSPNFGATFSTTNGKTTVRAIRANSSAELSGLSVKDEVLGFNGYRIEGNELTSMISDMSTGKEFTFLVARDQVLLEIKAKMIDYEKLSYSIKLGDNAANSKECKYLLRTVK